MVGVNFFSNFSTFFFVYFTTSIVLINVCTLHISNAKNLQRDFPSDFPLFHHKIKRIKKNKTSMVCLYWYVNVCVCVCVWCGRQFTSSMTAWIHTQKRKIFLKLFWITINTHMSLKSFIVFLKLIISLYIILCLKGCFTEV